MTGFIQEDFLTGTGGGRVIIRGEGGEGCSC